jgi:hypothetical protein
MPMWVAMITVSGSVATMSDGYTPVRSCFITMVGERVMFGAGRDAGANHAPSCGRGLIRLDQG